MLRCPAAPYFAPAALLLFASALAASPLVTYPAGTLLENIAIAPSGDIFATAIDSGSVFRISPSGSSQLFAQLPGPALGVALNTDGSVVVAGGNSVYRFAPDGAPLVALPIAGATDFLNGIALFSTDTFLVTDDTANTLWLINVATGSSQAWLSDPLLVPLPGGLPIGPNGIKLFDGAVYVSVTGSGLILKIPVLPDGSAGAPEVYVSNLQADDFAFGANGSLFAATQVGEIIRVDPDGTRTTIATGTLGDAAVAFGRTAADNHDLYVVNNGGAFLGLPDGPEAASVIRLATDVAGVVPEAQAIPEPATLLLSGLGIGIVWLLRTRRRASSSCALMLAAAAALRADSPREVATQAGDFTLIDFPDSTSTQLWGVNGRGEMAGVYVSIDKVTHGFLFAGGRFTSIDFPGSALTAVNGLNSRGDIVGDYATTTTGPHHGFLLSGGRFTTIDFPGATTSFGIGIAANGDIAGIYDNPARGFLLRGDKFTGVDCPGMSPTVVNGMSPQGDIVGGCTIGGVSRASLYRNGEFTTWEYPGANGFTNAVGRNAAGDTVGRYRDAAGVSHGYVLSNGKFTSFEYPGASFTGAAGITPDGDIVGRTTINGVSHGFYLKRGRQPRYQVTDLGTLGGKSSAAFGINNAGAISGWATVASGDQHPFLWQNGKMTDLGGLGGANGAGSIPNGALQIALATETGGTDPFGSDFCGYGTGRTCVAAIWKDGKVTQVPALGGNNAIGYATNERGQMVGVAEKSAADPQCRAPQKLGFAPVIWGVKPGEIQELPLPAGDTAGWAILLNDRGDAVGATGTCANTVGVITGSLSGQRAVLWENGVPRDLGSFGGPGDTLAVGLNNRTEIVGSSSLPDGTSHGFLWSRENGMEDIGAVGMDALGAPASINNARQVVGGSCDADFNCRAMIWERYSMLDLNDLVPVDSPLHLGFATWINDVGEIVGLAVDKQTDDLRAFLLTPVKTAAPSEAPKVSSTSTARLLPEQVRARLQGRLTGLRSLRR